MPLATHVPRRTLFDSWGVPQPPGNIVGTVNDPVKLPKPDAFHGSYHWSFERLIATSLVPLVVMPLSTGHLSPVLDAVLGGLLVTHCFIGLQSCIIDYIPKRKFPKGHKVSMGLALIGSGVAFWGVYELETKEEGLCGAAAKIWHA